MVDADVDGFLMLLATRRAPRTVEAYRRDLAQLAAWRSGPVAAATTEELERWIAEMRADGVAASTIARRVAALRSFFRHSVLIGARDDNHAAALQLPNGVGLRVSEALGLHRRSVDLDERSSRSTPQVEDAKFEGAAVRWLVRLAEERRLSLAQVQLAAVAVGALRAEPERALRVLGDL